MAKIGLIIALLLVTINLSSQLKFEYENGKAWKLYASTEKQKEFIATVRIEDPDILFWSGIHAPQEYDAFIVTVPLNKEAWLLKEIQSLGMHYEEHIELLEYLQNGTKVLNCLPLVKRPEEFISQLELPPLATAVQTPSLVQRTYVTATGEPIQLNMFVDDFNFDMPPEEIINGFVESDVIDIYQRFTIPNRSPATVSVTLADAKTLTKTVTISFTETLNIGGSVSLSMNIADLGLGGSGTVTVSLELSSTQTVSWSDIDTYSISKTITIPPFTTISSHGYVNWVQLSPVPFTATATIDPSLPFNGTGPPPPPPKLYYCDDGQQWSTCYYNCGPTECDHSCAGNNSCSCCSFTIDSAALNNPFVIRDYLIANGEQNIQVIGTENGKLQLRFAGKMTGSWGTDTIFIVEVVDDPDQPGASRDTDKDKN